MTIKKLIKGFTLIEMLLVMVIISILLYASINYVQQRAQQQRIDRTSAQMQQILNAGLSYYISNGTWPTDINTLQQQGYLTSGTLSNGWGEAFVVGQSSAPPQGTFGTPPPMFFVWTAVTQDSASSGTAAANANAIAGNLPFAYSTSASASGSTPPAGPGGSGYSACEASTKKCYVVAMVNIPGQNLNNARAMNYAGVYHHGACVPVPQCPVDTTGQTMKPQIMVVPVSVSGVNDPTNKQNVYPISSFTAFATEPGQNPPACPGGEQVDCGVQGTAANAYWRVCLQVITELGNVNVTNTNTGSKAWGQYATLAAFTRCEVNQEAAGSPLTVFSN